MGDTPLRLGVFYTPDLQVSCPCLVTYSMGTLDTIWHYFSLGHDLLTSMWNLTAGIGWTSAVTRQTMPRLARAPRSKPQVKVTYCNQTSHSANNNWIQIKFTNYKQKCYIEIIVFHITLKNVLLLEIVAVKKLLKNRPVYWKYIHKWY